ncbi:MAG: zeta toxin family protein [Gemmatimonadetes bacterium]|nr:zeta toxin family protein [Gemmatimonadota bacterium]
MELISGAGAPREPPGAPQAIVIAGPNGAGKTTAAPFLLRDELEVLTYVNADIIARGLSGFAPEAAEREAGEMMLRWLDQLAAQYASFAFETTLAGRGHARRILRLIAAGYDVHLLYLWLPSADQAVARVRLRVRLGGHDIPEATIRRRYQRSVTNLVTLYMPIVTTWRVYDGRGFATGAGIPLIVRGQGDRAREVRDVQAWDSIRQQLGISDGEEV